MEVTLLGHQSWLITSGNTNILIDPVLYDSFGSGDDNSIEIYPPRLINFKAMPKIDAIILSHEHSDHFHIPTLSNFKNTPIFFSNVMVNCVENVISKFGLISKRIPFYKMVEIGNLEFIFYPADLATVFWESRVSQILIRSKDNPLDSMFIAVDALISQRYIDDVNNETLPLPLAVAVSNNSQYTPPGVLGSLDNFKDKASLDKKKIPGISLLKELLVTYLEGLSNVSNIIICGGGFTKKYDTYFGSFPLSNQNKLADIANYFSIDKNIFGPLPGQRLKLNKDSVCYIQPVQFVEQNYDRLCEIEQAGIDFKNKNINIDITPNLEKKVNLTKNKIETELKKLAIAFMLSEIGAVAVSTIAASTKMIQPYGLALKLYNNKQKTELSYYVLNLNSAQFEQKSAVDVNESTIPFGIELYLNDFYALINGEIQIWDLGGISIKSWYIGNSLNSPVAFLYSYLGEQIQMDLNEQALQHRWEQSNKEAYIINN